MFGISLETPSVKIEKKIGKLFSGNVLVGKGSDFLKIIVDINGEILWLFNIQSYVIQLNSKGDNQKDKIDKNILFYKKKKLK